MSATLLEPERTAGSEAPAPFPRTRRGGLALAALMAVCCIVSACYSAIVPAFEAPDEPGHYAYVRWIASGQGIPLQGQEPAPLQPEFSQPPLYYLAETPLAWLAGTEPANLPVWEGHHNPFQNRTDHGNVNLYLHSPAEAFPWSGESLGLHVMRLGNVLFVALLALATYGCAIELGFPATTAWMAAALLGLIPQVLFLGGALNADNAIASLSAASLYLLLRWLNRGPSMRTAAVLGLAAGGAALSKLSGLVAVALVLGFMGIRAGFAVTGNRHPALSPPEADGRRGFLRDLAITAVIGALVAGWWYVRNWLAFGDPLGWGAMLVSTGDMLRNPPLSFWAAFGTLMQHARSGLAFFGWTNLPVHAGWYWLLAALCLPGLGGFALSVWRASDVTRFELKYWLLLAWPLAFMISLARWIQVNTAADQWRLLFPAYPALALLLVLGWRQLRGALRPHFRTHASLDTQHDKRTWRRHMADASVHAQDEKRSWRYLLAVPAGLLALNIGSLALVLAPAYAAPTPFGGQVEHPVDIRFGNALQLVGYSTPEPLASRAGETVEVDLFWRTLTPPSKDYATDIGIIDAQTNLTWKELSIPDEGRAPMSAWQPGEIVRDRHRIRVRPDMAGVQSMLLSVIDPEPPGNHLPAVNGSVRLENDAVTLTRFMVLPRSAPTPAVSDNVVFQNRIKLVGHSSSQTDGQLRLTLAWAAEDGVPNKDYTVFVHMITPDARQVAQHDGQPGGGAYPTSMLTAGTPVPDTHVLDVSGLPAGDYKLDVGLYELSSGLRLPTSSGDGSVRLAVTLR